MSTASVEGSMSQPAREHLLRRTVEACRLAKEAAGAAAEGIASGSATLLNSLRQRERELDTIDREIDDGVTAAISGVGPAEAQELLACMKFMIGLERIGDLLLSFANSALAASGKLDPQDMRDLTQMATILEKMLTDVGSAFSARNIDQAVEVLRADAEMDRLRNLIFLRHIENPENVARQASLQVIFMTQSLERAGDHAKNLAEEVCHVVSGHTVRHVLMAYDKPVEQKLLASRRRDQRTLTCGWTSASFTLSLGNALPLSFRTASSREEPAFVPSRDLHRIRPFSIHAEYRLIVTRLRIEPRQ